MSSLRNPSPLPAIGLVALIGCVEPPSGPGQEPLPDLSFIAPSAPTEHEERGVDAEASAELGIRLEWERPPSGAVTEVTLSRAGEDGVFAPIGSFDPADSTTIDFVPELGTWRYSLEVRDAAQRTKVASDTVAVTLIRKAEPLSPAPRSVAGAAPLFRWSWPEQGALPRFVVRVESREGGEGWISPLMEFFAGSETIEIAYGAELDPPTLAAGGYRWRVDAVDPSDPYRGSESLWVEFEVAP